MTRGRLPASVYWRRRAFVLALAASLVFVIANVLSGGSDAKDDDPVAQQVSGDTTASQTITVAERSKGQHKGRKGRGARLGAVQGPSFDPSILVEPDGNCEPADVRITPHIEGAVAGKPVTIGLSLQTVQADACYFRIGADKISLKITHAGREVWTSRECPGAIPSDSVVVRRVVATEVQMTWSPFPVGKFMGKQCPGTRDWLEPGTFTASTAALGGEPAQADFILASPVSETITKGPRRGRHHQGDGSDQTSDTGTTTGPTGSTQNPSDTSTDEPRR